MFPYPPGSIRVIYFGAGTPTILATRLLDFITGAIQKNFNLANDCEITLEASVSDLSPEQIEDCFETGFNRFSLGL
jgi:oxygen-independent coproporphyrinogen-3 oxidase